MPQELVLYITTVGLGIMIIVWYISDPRTFHERTRYYTSHPNQKSYILTFIFVAIYLVTSLYLPWRHSDRDSTLQTGGLLLYLCGLFLAVWARVTMHTFWGPPAQHDTNRQVELVTSGPFSITRNPIYMGVFCMFAGFSIAMLSYSIVLCPLVLWLRHKDILIEEELLEQQFGDNYRTYRRKVPRYL